MPSPPICCSRTNATDSMLICDMYASKAFGVDEGEGRWQEVEKGRHGGASGNAPAKAFPRTCWPPTVTVGGPHSCTWPKRVEKQVVHSPATSGLAVKDHDCRWPSGSRPAPWTSTSCVTGPAGSTLLDPGSSGEGCQHGPRGPFLRIRFCPVYGRV